MLPYVVGIVLSIGVALFARAVGFDRDRAFYPAVLIVVASYYVLFAAMSGSMQTVVMESVVMTLFVIAAVAGFKGSTWIIVGALAAHGVQDAVHESHLQFERLGLLEVRVAVVAVAEVHPDRYVVGHMVCAAGEARRIAVSQHGTVPGNGRSRDRSADCFLRAGFPHASGGP